MVQNMKKECLVGQRIVYDYISKNGGFQKVQITKPLIQAFRSGWSKYESFLAQQKKEGQKEKEVETKKKKIVEELDKAKQRKRQLLEELAEQESVIREGNKRLRFD